MNEKEIEDAQKAAMLAANQKAESFNIWVCQECEGNPEFDTKDFAEHLKYHGIADPKSIKGSRTMTMHMDGEKWYQTSYTWKIAGMTFFQTIREKRARNDLMGFD